MANQDKLDHHRYSSVFFFFQMNKIVLRIEI